MLITSSEPLVVEAVSERKSLKNHQQIRHKLTARKLLIFLFIVTMLIMMIAFPESKLTEVASIKQQDIAKMHESVENVSSGLATTYFKTYCHQAANDCRKHDEELLVSLIELISNEKGKYIALNFEQSNSSHLPVQLTRPISMQVGSTSHHKTQKAEQLEWQSYLNQFEQQTLQQAALWIVKHPKLTTPRPKQTGIFDLVWDAFGLNDQYANIDDIVQSEGQEGSIWSIQGHFAALTVKSNYFISPAVLELNSEAEGQEKVTMLGLHIGLQREIKAVKLAEFSFKFGYNRLYCSSQDCQQKYAMVMFLFSKIKLRHLGLYEINRF